MKVKLLEFQSHFRDDHNALCLVSYKPSNKVLDYELLLKKKGSWRVEGGGFLNVIRLILFLWYLNVLRLSYILGCISQYIVKPFHSSIKLLICRQACASAETYNVLLRFINFSKVFNKTDCGMPLALSHSVLQDFFYFSKAKNAYLN